MNIHRHNYEEFFLLYVDNELDATAKKEVEAFVKANPDLEEELIMLQQSILKPEKKIVFGHKDTLLKPVEGEMVVTADNYEEYFLLYADDELSNEEKAIVEDFTYRYPQYQADLELLQQIKLAPDTTVVMAHKESLYRYEDDDKVVAIRWWRMAAAAMVLLVGGAVWMKLYNTGDNGMAVKGGMAVQQQLAHTGPISNEPGHQETAGINPTPGAIIKDGVQGHADMQKNKNTPGVTNMAAVRNTNEHGTVPPRDAMTTQQPEYAQTSNLKELAPKEINTTLDPTGQKIAITKQVIASIKTPVINRQAATTAGTDQNDDPNYGTTALLQEGDNADNIEVLNTSVNRKTPLRGIFRKASRFIAKATNTGDETSTVTTPRRKGLLIGNFEIALSK